MLGRSIAAFVALVTATAASAQWVPGMEIYDQDVQVQTNGVVNTVNFRRDGTATISSPTGATVADATWNSNDGKLSLKTASTSDCYPYQTPFAARTPVDLRSDCGILSRWTALATGVLPGERG